MSVSKNTDSYAMYARQFLTDDEILEAVTGKGKLITFARLMSARISECVWAENTDVVTCAALLTSVKRELESGYGEDK